MSSKPFTYGTVCSGIEAPTVAWHHMGWQAQFFSEIEPFPCSLLKHYYPSIPNHGDLNLFRSWGLAKRSIRLLAGGTPCQAFSVAGLRKGLDDPRGNLALVYLGLAESLRPDWLVWENVPGVLSSNGGRDFGAFLGALVKLGYGFAYRVLDAQFFGVPQRRRRVFLVAHLGDWRPAAAVLFERSGLRGYPAPRRKTGQAIAGTLGGSSQSGGFRTTDLDSTGAFIVGGDRGGDAAGGGDRRNGRGAVVGALSESGGHARPGDNLQSIMQGYIIPEVANVLTNRMHKGINTTCDEGQTLIAFGHCDSDPKASEDLAPTMRSMSHRDSHANTDSHIAVAVKPSHFTRGKDGAPSEIAPPLSAEADKGDQEAIVFQPAVAFQERGREGGRNLESQEELAYALTAPSDGGRRQEMNAAIMVSNEVSPTLVSAPSSKASHGKKSGTDREALAIEVSTDYRVRRLTPRECERLQGFPDDYTLIPDRNGSENWAWELEEVRDYFNRTRDLLGMDNLSDDEIIRLCCDGPRYKALGNSIAIPPLLWIGRRISEVDKLIHGQE